VGHDLVAVVGADVVSVVAGIVGHHPRFFVNVVIDDRDDVSGVSAIDMEAAGAATALN
jgi:hypothetical protein